MSIGPPELILILVIVLIVFGAGKLPQVGSALGKGIREFRDASEGHNETAPPADAATTIITPPAITPPAITPVASAPPAVTPAPADKNIV